MTMSSGLAQVDRPTVLRMVACLRQAERTLDGALNGGWKDAQSYFRQGHKEAVQRLVADLDAGSFGADPTSNEALRKDAFEGGLWESFLEVLPFGRHFNSSRKTFQLRRPLVGFALRVLREFLRLLDAQSPTNETLVSLRMDACETWRQIERRCAGFPALEKAKNIEHPWFPDHLQRFSLEEILASDR